MSCRNPTTCYADSGRTASRLILAGAIAAARASTAFTQQPPALAPGYRPPTIALIVPADGATIPADKPVIVLRFAAGDPADAIDPASLRMAVDGEDRTALLQLGDGEAWGPLMPDSVHSRTQDAISAPAHAPVIAPGVHLVHARVCSKRGVCGMLDAPVTVVPVESVLHSDTGATADSTSERQSTYSLLRWLLDLAIAIARRLLRP